LGHWPFDPGSGSEHGAVRPSVPHFTAVSKWPLTKIRMKVVGLIKSMILFQPIYKRPLRPNKKALQSCTAPAWPFGLCPAGRRPAFCSTVRPFPPHTLSRVPCRPSSALSVSTLVATTGGRGTAATATATAVRQVPKLPSSGPSPVRRRRASTRYPPLPFLLCETERPNPNV
jgi:hypothetical protein